MVGVTGHIELTATGEAAAGFYSIVDAVDGVLSFVGKGSPDLIELDNELTFAGGTTDIPSDFIDLLDLFDAPVISNVSGCTARSDLGVDGCNTAGGDTLTVSGNFFGSHSLVSVGGETCSVTQRIGNHSVQCLLPALTGANLPVVVSVNVSDDVILDSTQSEVAESAPDTVSYSPPYVTGLAHTDCVLDPDDATRLEDCPNDGGGALTINGNNFGEHGAVVLVGLQTCNDLFHTAGSSQITCTLPPGGSEEAGITVVQLGGSVTIEARISYFQCFQGDFRASDSDLTCTPCAAGRYSDYRGAKECTDCPPGTYADYTGGTLCLDCPAGTYQELAKQEGCVDCMAGSYTDNSTYKYICHKCEAGRTQPQRGQNACVNCAAGRYMNALGSTSQNCTLCEPGLFSSEEGREICVPCTSSLEYSPITGSNNLVNIL